MSNIYSFPNRFFLVIDSTSYQIREPVGWDGVKAEMARDFSKYRYGFTDLLITDDVQVEFSQDPSDQGNRSFELLRDKFNQDGTDSEAIFRFEANFAPPGGSVTWTVVYTANVDFDPDKFEILDRSVKATLKTIQFEDKFNSRFETLVDIKSNVDLDGNNGTLYLPNTIKLHSKAIRKVSQGLIRENVSVNLRNFEEDLNEITYEDGSPGFIPSVSSVVNNPAGVGTDTITLGGQLFANTESRGYQYTISIDSEITTEDTSPVIPGNQVATMYLVDEINAVVTRTLVATSLVFPNFPQSWFVTQSFNFIKPNNDVDTTSYRIEIDVTPTNPTGPNIRTYLLRVVDFEFSITIDTLKPESNVSTWTLQQAGRRLIEATTGDDVYRSDITDSGCARNIGLTNGRFIKAQTDAEFNPKTSCKDFINSLGGMFNMGYGFEGTTIRHEPMEHYFQDVEVLQISNADLEEYSETAFSELFFNEVKTGYKNGFDQELFFVDDPQGDHEYLLPLISPKGSRDFRSDYIGSMYAIENKRREQFLRESSSNKFDDDIYLIKQNNIDEYESNNYTYSPNEIVLEGEYYDVDPGDNITIVGGPAANAYVVGDVTKEENRTFLENLNPATPGTGSFVGPYTLQLPTTRIVPERDENFTAVSNMISSETSYNLLLTPKRLLLNLSLWINSILNFKPGTDLIRNTFVKNNGNLITDADNNAVTCNDPDRLSYQEDADIAIEDLNQGNKLFTGRATRIRAIVDYDTIQLIMDANRNQLTGGDAPKNRGYLTVVTADGSTRSGWVYDMGFALNMEILEATLLEKA